MKNCCYTHYHVVQSEEGYIPDDNFAAHMTIEEAFSDVIKRAEHYRDGLAMSLDEPSARSEEETGKLIKALDHHIGLFEVRKPEISDVVILHSGDLVITIDPVELSCCHHIHFP